MKRNSLKKNFSWNFVGSGFYALTQWLTIIIFARLGDVSTVGIYSLALAITAPIIMFTNIQLRTVLATIDEKNSNHSYSHFFTVRFVLNIVFLISIIFLIFLTDYESSVKLVIFIVAISKIIESFSDITYGFFQLKERMDFISKSMIIKGTASLLSILVIFIITKDLFVTLIGLTIVWLSVYIFYDRKNVSIFTKDNKLSFNFKNIKKIIIIGLPLGVLELIVSLNSNIPKITIDYFLGNEALGYFSSVFYFVLIGSQFARSTGQAALPRLSILNKANRAIEFKHLLLKLVIINLLIGLIGVVITYLFGSNILNLVYGEEYSKYNKLFILVMIFGLFEYISYSLMMGLNALNSFKIQPLLGVIWLIVLIITLVFMLPKYGIEGVGYSLIIYGITRVITISTTIMMNLHKRT